MVTDKTINYVILHNVSLGFRELDVLIPNEGEILLNDIIEVPLEQPLFEENDIHQQHFEAGKFYFSIPKLS